jgi:hypothetical protein
VTLRSVRRIDAVSLLRADAAEVSAEGWRFYNAHFARTGSQRYGDKIEYRPDDEVEASFPSFELRPLTDLHPPSNVDSNTARILARGATSSARWAADHRHAQGRLAVWDAELIAKFTEAEARGEPMQLSAGYTLDLDETPGVDPLTGERYDAIQRNIRINHVAAVPLGRAGTARVLTDAADWVGAIDLGIARRLDGIRKDSRVIVDLGRWSRRDAADLRTQQDDTRKGRPTMIKIPLKLDGKIVEVEVADNATAGQIAEAGARAVLAAKGATDAERKDAGDALVKFVVDRALAEAQAKIDAMPPEFMKKKMAEEEEEEDAKRKKDAADLDLKLAAARTEARDHARTEARALSVLGMRYDGADKSIEQIRLDVIGHVLGEPKRKRIEALPKADQAGAAALAFAEALEQHDERSRGDHAGDLIAEIGRARDASNERKDSNAKPNKIAAEAQDTIENAGMTRAERAQKKAG